MWSLARLEEIKPFHLLVLIGCVVVRLGDKERLEINEMINKHRAVFNVNAAASIIPQHALHTFYSWHVVSRFYSFQPSPLLLKDGVRCPVI